MESTVHAREWITTATATWFLNELLTSTDPAIRDLAENIDWYIMPVFNVDGYAYTHRVVRISPMFNFHSIIYEISVVRTACGARHDSHMPICATVPMRIEILIYTGWKVKKRSN